LRAAKLPRPAAYCYPRSAWKMPSERDQWMTVLSHATSWRGLAAHGKTAPREADVSGYARRVTASAAVERACFA
jgi:hypothetical protein